MPREPDSGEEYVQWLDVMEQRLAAELQECLDRQYDGLFENGTPTEISKARKGIRQCLVTLAEYKRSRLEYVSERRDEASARVKEEQQKQAERESVEAKMRKVEAESSEKQQVAQLEERNSGIRREIRELEERLKLLRQELASNEKQIVEQQSVFESRLSSLRRKLSELGDVRALGEAQADVQALAQQEGDAETELTALNDGVAVWDDVVSTVKALNAEIVKHVADNDSHAVLDRITSATDKLSERLALSRKSNWKPLEIAISHELSAMQQASELLSGPKAK